MGLTGFLVDIGAHADCRGGTAVVLMGRHELDAAVPVALVVPIHNRRHLLAGLVFAGRGGGGSTSLINEKFQDIHLYRVIHDWSLVAQANNRLPCIVMDKNMVVTW